MPDTSFSPTIGQPASAAVPHSGTHVFALVAVLLCLAGELTLQLRLDWSLNPSYSYGWSVPFLAAFLFWMRWNERPEQSVARSKSLILTSLIGAAFFLLPLRIVAKANPDWRLTSWAIALGLVAITFCVLFLSGGWRWARHFAFPVCFCLVAVPWPAQFEQTVVQQLMRAVTLINVELLNAVGLAAVQSGNVIQLANGSLGVEDACSGIRSFQSTLMLSLFLGEFYSLRPRHRLVLIASGAVLAFGFNIARTFFLASVAGRYGVSAIARWHDSAGWSVIVGCLLGLWGMSQWLKPKIPAKRSPVAVGMKCLPVGILVALACWICLVEVGAELWFRVRGNALARAPQWTMMWPAPAEAFKDLVIPEEVANLLHYDEGRAIAWVDELGKPWNLFFFKWFPGRTAALFVKIHRPEICLPASGFVAIGEPRSDLVRIGNVALPTRAYRFQDGDRTLHVYYCYWDGTVFRDTQEMIEEDWTVRGRLHRAWIGRREQGAQTLELAVWGHEDDANADADLRLQLGRFLKDRLD